MIEVLGIIYPSVVAIGYSMYFYHNSGSRKH